MHLISLRIIIFALGLGTLFSFGTPSDRSGLQNDAAAESRTSQSFQTDRLPSQSTGGGSGRANDRVNRWAEKLGGNPLPGDVQKDVSKITGLARASEWLGPLAPIAISPFFGIACLAGISQFGGDFLPLNHFMSTNPVLNNPAIFWVFLGLTLVTSLPRFTKVSKPAAQAIDQLEAYAGIITILVIRYLPSLLASSDPVDPAIADSVAVPAAMVVQMGVFSFSTDVLLGVAAIINIVVINSVKFFFEIMVWMIPFPFVDGLLEVGNKSVCAGLMAVYAYSPTLATVLNLLLFVACLVVFGWVKRRVGFMRGMIADPIWSLINPSYGKFKRDRITVFPQENLFGFSAKSKLVLRSTKTGWELLEPRFLRTARIKSIEQADVQLMLKEGMLINSIEVSGSDLGTLLFSRRYRNQSAEICRQLKVTMSPTVSEADLKSVLTG